MSQIKRVEFDGYVSELHILPDDCVTISDEREFVRIKPSRSSRFSLANLVWEANASAIGMQTPSLTACTGYHNLLALRNDASISEDATSHQTTLFESPESRDEDESQHGSRTKTKKSKTSMSQAQVERAREVPTAITITINIAMELENHDVSIEVLKAIHPCDGLFILHDMRTWGYVVKYLRESGFVDPRKDKLQKLPTGITRPKCYQAADKVLACYKSPSGKRSWCKSTLPDAIAWQEQMATVDEAESAEQDDSQAHRADRDDHSGDDRADQSGSDERAHSAPKDT